MDQLRQLITIANNAYGLDDPGVAEALLRSDEHFPRSELAYWLADEGRRIYHAAMEMLHDHISDNCANAIGVLGSMLTG